MRIRISLLVITYNIKYMLLIIWCLKQYNDKVIYTEFYGWHKMNLISQDFLAYYADFWTIIHAQTLDTFHTNYVSLPEVLILMDLNSQVDSQTLFYVSYSEGFLQHMDVNFGRISSSFLSSDLTDSSRYVAQFFRRMLDEGFSVIIFIPKGTYSYHNFAYDISVIHNMGQSLDISSFLVTQQGPSQLPNIVVFAYTGTNLSESIFNPYNVDMHFSGFSEYYNWVWYRPFSVPEDDTGMTSIALEQAFKDTRSYTNSKADFDMVHKAKSMNQSPWSPSYLTSEFTYSVIVLTLVVLCIGGLPLVTEMPMPMLMAIPS